MKSLLSKSHQHESLSLLSDEGPHGFDSRAGAGCKETHARTFPKELSGHKKADGFQIHGQVVEKEGAHSRGSDGGGEGVACFNASLVIIVTGMNG